MGTTPTINATHPHQSMIASRAMWLRCSERSTTNSAAAPSGTLIQKIHRHPAMPKMLEVPARNPPISGPSTEDVANTAMK